MYVSTRSFSHAVAPVIDPQTLPIGYYPTLTDESLDKVLLDQSQYTVEWMVTPAAQAKALDERALLAGNHYVSSGVAVAQVRQR